MSNLLVLNTGSKRPVADIEEVIMGDDKKAASNLPFSLMTNLKVRDCAEGKVEN
jgi:hypothetical protein